jgi:hypothetical protein
MNSKLLALRAQERFQGERERERERERKTNQVSRSQIGRSDVGSHWLCPALQFLVFLHMSLGHAWFRIEPDSRVLCVCFILQNNFVNVLLFHHLFYFFAAAAQRNRILNFTGIE